MLTVKNTVSHVYFAAKFSSKKILHTYSENHGEPRVFHYYVSFQTFAWYNQCFYSLFHYTSCYLSELLDFFWQCIDDFCKDQVHSRQVNNFEST